MVQGLATFRLGLLRGGAPPMFAHVERKSFVQTCVDLLAIVAVSWVLRLSANDAKKGGDCNVPV